MEKVGLQLKIHKCKQSLNTMTDKLVLGLRLGRIWVRVRIRSEYGLGKSEC